LIIVFIWVISIQSPRLAIPADLTAELRPSKKSLA